MDHLNIDLLRDFTDPELQEYRAMLRYELGRLTSYAQTVDLVAGERGLIEP